MLHGNAYMTGNPHSTLQESEAINKKTKTTRDNTIHTLAQTFTK